MLCSCHITGRMEGEEGEERRKGEEAFAHLQVVTSVQGTAERVSAPGVIYLISNPFGGGKPGRPSHLYRKI